MAMKAKKSPKTGIQAPERDLSQRARMAAGPVSRASIVGSKQAQGIFGELNLEAYHEKLSDDVRRVWRGDLSGSKAMMVAQANTLDLLFNSLIQRSAHAEYMPQLETFMRLALKAQAQAAHTVKVLGELENPKSVAFVRQQTNISSDGGPQQVNLGLPPSAHAHEATDKASNELLEQSNGEWLDTGAQGRAGRSDTTMETVEAINRPQD